MLRHYPEQKHIPDFEAMDRSSRKKTVMGIRAMNLGRPRPNNKQKELLKNYRKTLPYVHLTYDERKEFVKSLMSLVGDWEDSRLFGEAELFDLIYERFDRHKRKLVGLRHYTGIQNCLCRVCRDHGRYKAVRPDRQTNRDFHSNAFWSAALI